MAGSGSIRVKRRAGKERGESSTQQERLHTYDYERFSCVGAARWYDDNIKRKFFCEKKISEEIEGDLHIGDFFDFYGWRNIITIGGGYDPEIVRDFYAHMDMEPVTNNRLDSLGSCIRGMVVEITTEDIATFLRMGEVQKGGNLLKFKGNGAPTNETNFDYSRAYQVLGVDRSEERGVVYARFLQVSHRLVAYFIRHNIMPSSG